MRLAPEGLLIIAIGVGLSLIGWILFWLLPPSTKIPAVILSLLTCGLIFFFRDPGRIPPEGDENLLAPADGRILQFGKYTVPDGSEFRMVSIFLSLLNVHVNRSPVSGVVEKVEYRPGRFHIALKKDASTVNEMNRITIRCPKGAVITQQVAGSLARRVVCHLREGQEVGVGERIGIIKFGSRMDLIIPHNMEIKVNPGDKVKAGRTIIGAWLNE